MVVIGGDDGTVRDEVLCGILFVISCLCLQILQFNVEARTWRESGQKLEIGRKDHAIAEANLGAICLVGNLIPCPNLFKFEISYFNSN